MSLPIVEQFSREIMSMAKAYGLGSPESRAIITALDHARAVVGSDRLHEEIVNALEFYGSGIGFMSAVPTGDAQ